MLKGSLLLAAVFVVLLPTIFAKLPICFPENTTLEKPEFHTRTDTSKFCRYRIHPVLYPPEVFNLIAGAGCYSFTKTSRLKCGYLLRYTTYVVNNVTYYVQFARHNETAFVFDYTNEKYHKYIKYSFASDVYFNMWLTCAREAAACCLNYMDNKNIFPNEKYPCHATWDAWSCYPPGQAGKIVKMPCPSQIYTPDTVVCKLFSEKECFTNGTWNDNTNYETCSMAPVLERRHKFHITMLSISIALSLPAVIIFVAFPRLRILRVILHRNLLMAIIIRNCLSIMSKNIVILDSLKSKAETNGVMEGNSVACRVLAFFEVASKNAIYATMAVDGFYLHKLIVRAFANDPKEYILYSFVFVFSFLPTIIWATFRALESNEYCWMTDSSGYQWISDGCRIAILVLNTLLLCDILRVLFLKLKKNNSVHHTKAALKATLCLIPLFGLHMIIISNKQMFKTETCDEEDIYYYVIYSLESLQGFVVAILFCYCNSEVHREITNAYRKLRLALQQKFGFETKNENRRRTTAATYVPHYDTRNLSKNLNICAKNKKSTNSAVQDWLSGSGNDGDDYKPSFSQNTSSRISQSK